MSFADNLLQNVDLGRKGQVVSKVNYDNSDADYYQD